MEPVKVGDEVMVIPISGRSDSFRATVTKAARVWLTIEATNSRRVWLLRRDSQDEGSTYGHGGARFYTMNQWREHEERRLVNALLASVGIDLSYGWQRVWTHERLIELAKAVCQIVPEEDRHR